MKLGNNTVVQVGKPLPTLRHLFFFLSKGISIEGKKNSFLFQIYVWENCLPALTPDTLHYPSMGQQLILSETYPYVLFHIKFIN